MNKTEVEELRRKVAESCMAGHHYERTRGLRGFNMPKVGTEGLLRANANQHGTTYRFVDGSRLWISTPKYPNKRDSMKYALPLQNYIAVRALWIDNETHEPQGNDEQV
jgi:hypothetical protein